MGWLTGYSYRRIVTVDKTKVGGSLTDYPFLFNETQTYFRTVANGGKVQNASGYDIVFTADDGTTILNFEREEYDATSGLCISWIRIPAIDSSVNKIIYVYYGNSAISTSQENINGVWGSYYKGVYHLNVNKTAGYLDDSSVAGHDLVNYSTTDYAGGIGRCRWLTGIQKLIIPNHADFDFGSGDFTIEQWIYTQDIGLVGGLIYRDDSVSPPWFWGHNLGGGDLEFYSQPDGITQGGWKPIVTAVAGHKHLVGVSRIGNTFTIYCDGGIVSSWSIGSPIAFNAGAGDVQIGVYNETFGFEGWQDEIRFAKGLGQTSGHFSTSYNNQFSPSTFYSVGSEEIPAYQTYYLSSIPAPDSSYGTNFNNKLVRNTEPPNSLYIPIGGWSGANGVGLVDAGSPGLAHWPTGDWTIKVNRLSGSYPYADIQIKIIRTRADGYWLEETAYSAPLNAPNGVHTISFTGVPWTAGSADDRLAIVYQFSNDVSPDPINLTIELGTVNTEIKTPFPASVGWSHKWMGINPSKIMGIPIANIVKFMGIA